MLSPGKTRILLCLLLAGLCLPASARAETRRLELPFRAGMAMLIENNLALSDARLAPEVAGARVYSALGSLDPAVFGSFQRHDVSTPLGSRSAVAAGGRGSVESESYEARAGLTGRTSLGAVYTIEANSSWTADTFSSFEYEYDTFTGVTLTQPLLRGFGEASLLEIRLAGKDKEAAAHKLKKALLDALSDYGAAWWALVEAREAREARAESLRLAELLLEISRKKLEAGVLSRLELVQAEAAAAARKEELLTAGKAVQSAERALKELITGDAYAIRDLEIVPAGGGELRAEEASLQESIARAIEARPEYLEARAQIERSNITARYSRNQAFPELDLEASYGYNGLGDSLSGSVGSLDSNPQWRLGLSFKYPLGNRAATGALQAARLEARQFLLRLKRLEQEIVLRLDEAARAVASDGQRLEAAQLSVRLAEQTLEAEEKKLEAGRSTAFNVLRIQDDLLQARLRQLDAVAGYNRALIAFYREKGTLLEELGINFQEASEVR